jgi:hypothetical protein
MNALCNAEDLPNHYEAVRSRLKWIEIGFKKK